ncbi:MAG: cache domain-containing protein [Smithella sp.]
MKKGCLVVIAAFALIVAFYGWASAQESMKQDAMNMVEKAGKMIEEKGDAALAAISDPKGEFIDRKKALYVFVYDKDVVIVAHPYSSDLIGQSMKRKSDGRGKLFHDQIVKTTLTKGSSWTKYVWQKPVTIGDEITYQDMYEKNTYGKLFQYGDKKYIVCSGTYEE